MTFSKDGVYKVIPAAASPIDIINDVTGPTYDGNNGCTDFLENIFNQIGAWGVLILSIIIGLVLLIIEFKLLDMSSRIQTTALKVITVILLLAAFIFVDYSGVKFVIELINKLGGL